MPLPANIPKTTRVSIAKAAAHGSAGIIFSKMHFGSSVALLSRAYTLCTCPPYAQRARILVDKEDETAACANPSTGSGEMKKMMGPARKQLPADIWEGPFEKHAHALSHCHPSTCSAREQILRFPCSVQVDEVRRSVAFQFGARRSGAAAGADVHGEARPPRRREADGRQDRVRREDRGARRLQVEAALLQERGTHVSNDLRNFSSA